MAFRKIEAGLVHADVDQFIGKTGTIFYDNSLGDFRISDGQTPGGIALSFGGGEGGTYTLPTATTTVKGGVKIDGSTITIANQVISVGTVPYTKLSGTPTIPTNNNQLTNGAAYITSAALSGLATETYVTTRGYLTTVAYADVTGKPTLFSGSYADLTNKPTIPTNNNELTNGAGYITSSALTGLATETYVTTRGYLTTVAYADVTGKPTLFSGSYTDLTNKPTIPTDINQLTDASGLLGGGGGGGGTTYITNTVENPYSFSIAGDDSTLREIANGESIKITGSSGVTVTTDAEGNVTITGPNLSSYATQSYVTNQGYITSSALTGLATETYVTTRGYLTTVSYADVTDKPTLFSGSYTDLTNKPTLFSGSYADLTNKPTIPTDNNQLANGAGYITSSALAGLATETYVTTRGYITSSALTGLATESYVTSRGYITGLSWNQLTDKPNLAGTYSFNVAADDSTLREISSDETVKFIGAGGITTSSDAEGAITITGPSLTGLATETYVNQAVTNLVDGAPAMLDTLKELALSLNNDSNLAATLVTEINKKANIADLVLTIAGDDSTEKTISLGEGIRLQGTGSITITTDLEGKVTINGAAPDLSAYALTSAVPTNNNQLTNGAGYITTAVNANGTFSLPILSAEPANLQAGQIALANGTSWDPLDKAEGRLYTALYTGTGWIEIGGLTENKAYGMILGG
jgi:hypothetical protein